MSWQVFSDITGTSGQNFGYSVSSASIDTVTGVDTYVAIGSPGARQVEVYEYSNYRPPVKIGTTITTDGTSRSTDNFGVAVAISQDGKYVVIGNPNYSSSATNSNEGQICVYHYDTGSSTWVLVKSVTGISAGGKLGYSVAITLNNNPDIVVAAGIPYLTDPKDPNTGIVRVFTNLDNLGNNISYNLNYYGPGQDNFNSYGTSISLSSDGNTLVVSMPVYNAVQIHYRILSGSTDEDIISPTLNPFTQSTFGPYVSIAGNGNHILVGSSSTSFNGYASIYDLSGGVWSLRSGTDQSPALLGSEKTYGTSVSMSYDGLSVAVGAPSENSFGVIHTYDWRNTRNGMEWVERPTITTTIGSANLGQSLSLSDAGHSLFFGAPGGYFTSLRLWNKYVLCLTKGTRVLTPNGYLPVETIRKHDYITTHDGRNVMVKYIHQSKHYSVSEMEAPFLVCANSYAENIPLNDIKLSPDHLIHIGDDLWMTPRQIAKKSKDVVQYDLGNDIHYFAIMTSNYFQDNLVIEDGVVVESYGYRKINYDTDAKGYRREAEDN